MKIIINTSTLLGSGVTQVAVSFLYECLKLENSDQYYVFLGENVSKSINKDDFDARFKFYFISPKPLPIVGKGLKSLFKMKKLEAEIKPDAVFSIFGPSWWTPKSPHLQGYAYPHYVFPESPYFKIISLMNNLKIKTYKAIHKYFLLRNGKYFVTETDIVSKRLVSLLNISNNSVFTVSNTCNSFFREFKQNNKVEYLPSKMKNEFRCISLCTMQDHKNLTILNKVIPLLIDKGYCNVKFILTIDNESFEDKFENSVKKNIINVGRIPPENCPYLFDECDALFLPTLLECFSANYPEAMYLKKPIITSDLPFAKDICRDSAIYFNALDENSIVDKIELIINDEDLKLNLIQNGLNNLKRFSTPKQRAIKYLEILKNISNEES